jgi:glycosyltransferase involved in cell wall biosynthesis
MKIVVAKPDFGVTGGFERVLDRVRDHLRAGGHQVVDRSVRVAELGRAPYGLAVPDHVWDRIPEYFRYLAMVEAFGRLPVDDADVVLSTQPPSFAVEHPGVVALFYHHLRIAYDLSDVYVRAGFEDPALHAFAAERVRAVDAPSLDRVATFLAGSREVMDRLATYNGRTEGVRLFLAGADVEPTTDVDPPGRGPALCVSRSEFPKRTELFVVAAHHLPDHPFVLVGDGGRLPFARALDARLGGGTDPASLDDTDIWCNRGLAEPGRPDPAGRTTSTRTTSTRTTSTRTTFAGRLDDRDLDRAYRTAGCVVAPAYREDYGLTVLEAHARGRPVIVCRDGGGLVDLVEDGITGLVVEPTGQAVADAVRRLRDDPGLAAALGDAGRDALARYRWSDALALVDEVVESAAARSR